MNSRRVGGGPVEYGLYGFVCNAPDVSPRSEEEMFSYRGMDEWMDGWIDN